MKLNHDIKQKIKDGVLKKVPSPNQGDARKPEDVEAELLKKQSQKSADVKVEAKAEIKSDVKKDIKKVVKHG